MPRPRRRADEARDVFAALADPNRRRAIELLAGGERSVQDLAEHFPMSLASVSQHLQILHAAGVVRRREVGRRRLYALDRAGLASAQSWLSRVTSFWEDALDRLETHLDQESG